MKKPHEVLHTAAALSELAASLKQHGGEVRVVMEHTRRHWLPVATVLNEAGLFVSAVNPNLISSFSDNKLRNIKNDKADSRKLAHYGLRYWTDVKPYVPTEITRQKLLEFSRQLNSSNKLLTGLKNNLQAIVVLIKRKTSQDYIRKPSQVEARSRALFKVFCKHTSCAEIE